MSILSATAERGQNYIVLKINTLSYSEQREKGHSSNAALKLFYRCRRFFAEFGTPPGVQIV
jgi:hypothetical protein